MITNVSIGSKASFFKEIYGDITKQKVDIIVNAANTKLLPGLGVCGAIHNRAGPKLESECRKLGGCNFGKVKITKAYNLPARYVIHTVGPIYGHHKGKEPEILLSCYYRSLVLASNYNAKSIAFPAISAGLYSYPYGEVLKIANKALRTYITNYPETSLKQFIFVHFK